MRRDSLKQFAVKGAVMFFIIMGVLTYFSSTIEYLLLPAVTVADLSGGKLGNDLSKEAQIVYEKETWIYSAGDAVISEILVRSGDHIEKGDPVLSLNTEILEIRKEQKMLEKIQVQNELNSLYRQWEDPEISDREKETLADSLEQKQFERDLLDKEYDSMCDGVDENGNILAAASGIVSDVMVENGQAVLQGEALIRLAEEGSEKKVQFELEESETDYYRNGAVFEITYSAEDKEGNRTEQSVQGSLENMTEETETGRFLVTGKIAEEIPELEYGQAVRVTLSCDGTTYEHIIPVSAIEESSGRKVVYVLREDEKGDYYVKQIQVGLLEENGYFAAVEAKFEYGDRVVASANKSLDDRSKVRLQE